MAWKLPSVRLLGQTMPDLVAIQNYLADFHGLHSLETLGPAESILSVIAGKRCYRSFVPGANPNVTKIREDVDDYIDNILKQGHGSVLEHISFNFAFENVSRNFTHELVRHRVGVAISQESLRYVRLGVDDEIPMRLRPCFDDPNLFDNFAKWSDDPKIKRLQAIYFEMCAAVQAIGGYYHELLRISDIENETDFAVKKVLTSMLRDILPMGMATGMVWTVNARALRNIFDQRLSEFAEEEIRWVMIEVLRQVKTACPALFADYKILEDGSVTSEYGGV